MQNENKDQIVEDFAHKINEMKMGFSNLREALKPYHFSKNEEDELVKLIDDRIYQLNARKESIKFKISSFWIGLTAFIIGITITVGTWIVASENGGVFIFTFGLIGYGVAAMFKGNQEKKKRSLVFKSKFKKPADQ